ncbi:DUF1501 domain-containing protein [Pseudoalteromonas phenolica]|uniref:DUF1501 domain-containing protein n=1 Tax=Pseudoalteromonas phenolica TaxID=161398 RepID=A0A0S2K146_9GAMM|nr:DUF1501 domain-containing protein [Pseudoalteromonas phenolica]ALO42247.1 hypothetical protein PP2015_1745 [Pseudoalteromonas phenolica]MBE0356660.1 hypothetical protein [Pseudoalteromonas phenolica O-BC30]
MNRRKFLSYCMKGGVSVAALTQLQLQAFQGSLSYSFDDHKALVCVFLFGGNDSLNMLVPLEGEQRTLYEASRQNLAVTDAIQMAPETNFAGGVGLHPAMGSIKNIFDNKNLAFISGVGSLVMPTTKADYQNESVPLPKHLFSHNDQQATWMHGREKISLNSGWGARLLERLEQGGSFVNNISLAGTNPWQTSVNLTPFSLHRSGISKINPINGTGNRAAHVKNIMNRVLAQSTHPLASAYGTKMRKAITNTEAMNSAIESSVDLSSYFSDSSLSQQLHTVAKSISVRQTLNAKRQIYFVSMGGFDTHDNQLTTHPALLSVLSQSLSEFNAAISFINANDDVTLFTMSDFGRTLTSNGDGTDHGWAGNQILMGGAVNGGEIYGTLMTQHLDGPNDTRGGRLIPQVANEQYFASLAQWFGLDNTELVDIFPNLANFNSHTLPFMRS